MKGPRAKSASNLGLSIIPYGLYFSLSLALTSATHTKSHFREDTDMSIAGPVYKLSCQNDR